ncbi:sigma-70 family RNA polymerase sigma factor [Niallia sp. XMNu-256]|uniref:sigma-70 family RNA polymerase sigma factor n=1 Tax=Niallia sp. XMNu-256 TaxID=3082444 RepID=UPI0030CB738D
MKNGPVISNISLINKAFLEQGSPLHYRLIVDYLRVNWAHGAGTSEKDARYVLDVALNAGFYYEEVEEQHYQRKQSHCSHLDELYDTLFHSKVPMKQQLRNPLYQISNLFKDPRFTIMETEASEKYILLSEWNLINDLALQLFIKEHIENISIFEAVRVIKEHYQISDPNAFFFPHFDNRFTVKSNGKVSLKSYDESNLHSLSTEVTSYIREEVARSTPKLVTYLKNQYGEEVKIRSLIKAVFNIEVHYPKFPAYFLSVREHLQQFPSIRLTSHGDSFMFIENEDVTIIEKTLLQGVTDTSLLDQKIEKLPSPIAVDEITNTSVATSRQNQTRTSLSYTVRYYDRIQETIAAHYFKDWITADELHVNLIDNSETLNLTFFYDRSHNILHGTHLENLMSDYAIVPGQQLHFQMEDGRLTLKISHVNEARVKEQERYLDIARLAEENQLTEKSLLQIVTETLIYHPSGLHVSEIIKLVKKEVPYAENSITATLSGQPYFEKVPQQKGFWIFNPAKWKKGNIEKAIHSIQTINQEKYKTTKHIPQKVKSMAEYFRDLAIVAQKNPRRLTNEMYMYMYMDETAFLERAWTIYAHNIYRYAKKYASNEIPLEDYIQQAYFALKKAYKNYKPSNKNSFYRYFKIYLSAAFKRYRQNKKNLIRIPVHRIEELEKFDKEAEMQLLLDGYVHIDNNIMDDYTLFKTNYISLEELYLYESQFENCEDDSIRGYIFSYFSKPSDLETYRMSKATSDFIDVSEPDYTTFSNLMIEDIYDSWDKDFWIGLWTYLDKKNRSIPPSSVIKLRFGMNHHRKEHTLEQIGELYGVTRERIRQIEQKALITAKEYFQRNGYHSEDLS